MPGRLEQECWHEGERDSNNAILRAFPAGFIELGGAVDVLWYFEDLIGARAPKPATELNAGLKTFDK